MTTMNDYFSCKECGEEPGTNDDCYLCIGEAAACILTFKDGKILGVSRKDDPNDWGIPGGKIERGESPMQAAQRECAEETGLYATNLRLLFAEKSNHLKCWTFLADVEGEIQTEEAGRVAWIGPGQLLLGSFAPYNRRMFTALGYIVPEFVDAKM